MRLVVFAALAVVLLGADVVSHAETITYTESATVSGSLDGVTFTNRELTLTGSADTSQILFVSGGLYQVALPIEGSVAGIGTFTLTGDDFFSSESGDIVGVVHGSDVILDTFNLSIEPYNLGSPTGPYTGQAFYSVDGVVTSVGALDIDSGGPSTFQATVASPTPEPAAMLLVGTGLLGLAAGVRRRHA